MPGHLRTLLPKMAIVLLALSPTAASAQTGAPAADPAPTAACINAVQGKVAWNRAGDKTWAEGRINWFCSGFSDAAAVFSCFEAQIRITDNWRPAGLACNKYAGAALLAALKSPRRWQEIGNAGEVFAFAETSRDDVSVHVSDSSRNIRLQLDLARKTVLLADGSAPLRPFYPIASSSAVPNPAGALATELACSERGNLKSGTGQPAQITFLNNSGAFRALQWIDSRGELKSYDGLLPGEKRTQQTHLSHPWLVADQQENCLRIFLPGVVPATVELASAAANSPSSSSNTQNEVQVVYVIPNGPRAKPGAEAALAAIMAVMQRHYFQQLGVTFKLRSPLVSTVAIKERTDELVGPAMSARTRRLAETELEEGYVGKGNVVVAVFEGLNHLAGQGSSNLVSIPSWIWNESYEMFKKSPAQLHQSRYLHGWSHELGLAFGLMLTENARACFVKHNVDIGRLPSLIMQKTDHLASVYEYPFIAQEKQLLLDASYFPDCRPFLHGRPHGSQHLRHPLP